MTPRSRERGDGARQRVVGLVWTADPAHPPLPSIKNEIGSSVTRRRPASTLPAS